MNQIKSLVFIFTLSALTNHLLAFGEGKVCKGQYNKDEGEIWHECIGEVSTQDGVYKGNFRFNAPNGKGTNTWESGQVYEGEWVDGQPSGKGTMTTSDGGIYVGDFVDGKQEGQGVWNWKSGDEYIGQWKAGEMHGKGTYTYNSGTVFVGEMKEGEPFQGRMLYANGNKFNGEFEDGRLKKGTLTTSDGINYDGEFLNGKQHGYGTLKSDGNTYIGNWKNGDFHGYGKLTSSDGIINEGLWINRNLVGDSSNHPAFISSSQSPVYPRRALERGIEGCVMLSYTVTADGKSKDPKVDWSVPTSSMFWQNAIDALSENEFFPALVEGKTVDSDFKSITVFKIEDPNKPADYVPEGCE